MNELVFDVVREADGGFCAKCLSDTIVTEGNSWEELRRNLPEVVRSFKFDQSEKLPGTDRFAFVKTSGMAVQAPK